MMKKILKLIVDNPGWVNIPTKTKYSDIPENERDNNNWWYLHCNLEDYVGYDKATAINCDSIGISKETIYATCIIGNKVESVFHENIHKEMHFTGIIDVEIEGIDKPCIGYFWVTKERDIIWKNKTYPYWKQRGLVCFKDDIDGCKDAYKKYSEQLENI